MKPSLILYREEHELFRSSGNWLYPLFELEEFLKSRQLDRGELRLYDKVTGRAGALLQLRLGIRQVHTDLLSSRAEEVFRHHGIHYTAETVTERILCKTEELLADTLDPEEAYRRLTDLMEENRKATRRQEEPQPAAADRTSSTDRETSTDERHAATAEPPEPGAALRVRNLNVVRGGRHVLASLDLDLALGGRLLIAGENGSGKTTLIKTILGLIEPTAGRVEVLGALLGSPEWRRARTRVGYVHQDTLAVDFPVTVSEIVSLGTIPNRHARDGSPDAGPHGAPDAGPDAGPGKNAAHAARDISQAMEIAGCAHLQAREYRALSGGERQRVEIARCLAQGPSLLLLDEPTAHLDPESRQGLVDTLERVSEAGVAVLAATHDLSLWEEQVWPRVELPLERQ
jgi:ABC-type Mn2+/Zn2+ transport system ATPase subunit